MGLHYGPSIRIGTFILALMGHCRFSITHVAYVCHQILILVAAVNQPNLGKRAKRSESGRKGG